MKVILFDGHCNLCNRWVQFVLKRDPSKKIRFAPLQSEIGKKILEKHKFFENYFESIVLVADGEYYVNSTAAIKTLSMLSSWERFLKFLIFVPRPIRDFFYLFVAKNRYKWFGRSDICMLPSPEISERFLKD